MAGFNGYSAARQIFPRGYALFDSEFMEPSPQPAPRLDRPIELLMLENDSGTALQERMARELKDITGRAPNVTMIRSNEFGQKRMDGKFDFVAASLAVSDPNYEGAVTFFFTSDPPIFLSGPPPFDFAEQIAKARTIENEIEKGRRLKDVSLAAVRSGYAQRLFHFSSLTLAKPGLDLTHVPPTDEVVAFSKIRIVKGSRR